jgi:hypothetical protein
MSTSDLRTEGADAEPGAPDATSFVRLQRGGGVVRRIVERDRAAVDGLAGWWARTLPVFAWGLCGSFAAFGIGLFTPSLSVDEEVYTAAGGVLGAWIGQDRWAMFLISMLIPLPPLPFITMLIGLIANALAASLAVGLLGGESRPRNVLAALFATCCPTLCFVLQFDTSQFGFLIGLLSATAAVRCGQCPNASGKLAGWALLVFAVSVYQSLATVALVLLLGSILNRCVLEKDHRAGEIARVLIAAGVWLGTALIAHKLIAIGLRRAMWPGPGYVLVDSVYNGRFVERYSLTHAVDQVRRTLLGGAWYMGWQTTALLVACLVVILARLIGMKKPWAVRIIGVLMLALMLMAPFSLSLMTGAPWPTRTLLGVPFLMLAVTLIATGVRARPWMWVLTPLSCLCILHFVVSANRLMYADFLTWQADRALAVHVQFRVDEIRAARSPRGLPKARLAVIGVPSRSATPVRFGEETIGASLFEWGDGNPTRVAHVLHFVGAQALAPTSSREDYRRAVALAAEMPDWPADGSVQLTEDGLAVVRFGEPTALHLHLAR